MSDPRITDWATWLSLSAVPNPRAGSQPLELLHLHGGTVTAPHTWPKEAGTRVYVAYGDHNAVYVGQTTQPLLTRIRNHLGRQTTALQQAKAGTWQFIVSASFDGLIAGELDRLERSAAEWLLPLALRSGRRHPTPQGPDL